MNWSEQVVLVTGGTGSFGRKFVELMLQHCHPQKVIIFSRDELKQHDMRAAVFESSEPFVIYWRRARSAASGACFFWGYRGGSARPR